MTRNLAALWFCLTHAACVLALGTPLAATAQTPVLESRQTRILGQICARCHVRPGLGVPILGDEAEWVQRRAKGLEVLVANTVTGIRDMPPLGTCGFCTEDDFRRLAAFMAGLPLPGDDGGSRP